jgi:hypothetical protein
MHQFDPPRPDPDRRASRRRRARAVGIAAVALGAALVPATAGFGQGGPKDPKGNNGTIKIDGAPWDDHPNNEPHPGCTFQVDFYGFDAGVGDAQVVFALQAPTTDGTLKVLSGDLTPNIGEDAAGGGTDLDASETYALGFTGAAHPKQGYHVKLTVHAPGSIGADTKHKVFWVSGCDAPQPTTTTAAPTTTIVGTPENLPGEGPEAPSVEGLEENASPGSPTGVGAEGSAATPTPPGATAVQGTPALTG